MIKALNFLKRIDLDFSDYLLIAIIFAILHLITLIEISIVTKNKDTYILDNLKFLTTWSLSGIIITIFLGLIAEYFENSYIDTVLIVIPIIFFSVWGKFQFQYSTLIDTKNTKTRLKNIKKQNIK